VIQPAALAEPSPSASSPASPSTSTPASPPDSSNAQPSVVLPSPRSVELRQLVKIT
jgi:hypothetical protein